MMTKMLQTASKQYITQTRFIFHCHFKIKIPLEYGESFLDSCFELLENIDKRYNSYQSNSLFDQINKQAGNWVKVDSDCIKLLQTVLQISELTNGSFDISCMPLLQLWGFYRNENNKIPSESEIDNCLKKVDYRKIEIQENKVRIAADQQIITGSFIKAFAVDKLVEMLKKAKISDAIINAGGSTIMALNDASHPSWKINIPDSNNSNEFMEQIQLSNQCFSLSAKANNHLIIKGKSYGHILNAKTGFPSTTNQVGIITQNALLGDLLSTAIFSLSDNETDSVVQKLALHFDFAYFKRNENNIKTYNKCF